MRRLPTLLCAALLLAGCASAPGGKQAPVAGKQGPASGAAPRKGDHKVYVLDPRLLPAGAERQHHARTARVRINLGTRSEDLERMPGALYIHVSRDDGRTWEAPRPVELEGRSFRFNFARDENDSGEGRFGIQLAKAVRPPPPLPAGTRPASYIVVDRTPPKLSRFNLPPEQVIGAGSVPPVFSWIARDASPELKIRLEYRTADAEQWQPIAGGIEAHLGRHEWKPVPAIHARGVRFRCTATDLAGNQAVLTPKEAREIDGLPPAIRLTGQKRVTSKTGEVSVPFAVRKVGPSKLERVQAWVSNGSGWQLHRELPASSPATLRFAEDGSYGITLVAIDSARNHSPIPAGPARPELMLVVDRQPPELEFTAELDPRKFYHKGERIRLAWSASDANLTPRPVELFYQTEDGKKHPIGGARGARGTLDWALPDLQGQLVLAALAKDEAGHQTWRIWPATDKPGKVQVENTWAYAAILLARPSADKKKIVVEYEVRDLGVAPLLKVDLYWRSGAVRDWILSRENKETRRGAFRLEAPPGTYDFYVRAVTRSRSEPVPTRKTQPKLEGWIFSPRVPTVKLKRYPGRGEVYPGGQQVTLEWEAGDAGPDVSYTIEYSDGQSWKPVVPKPKQGETLVKWRLPVITADRCQLRFQVSDRMHGRATYTMPGQFSIDSSPPRTTKVIGPALTSDGKLSLRVQVADQGKAGVGRVRIWYQPAAGRKWIEADSAAVGGGFRSEVRYSLSLRNEGTYRFHVSAADRVGNVEPPPESGQTPHYVVTLDRTPPQVTLAEPPAKGALRVGDTLAVIWSAVEAHPAERGTTLLYSSDGGASWVAFAQEQPASGRFAWKLPEVVDGRRIRLQAQVRDRAGNTGKGELARELQIGAKELDVVAIEPSKSASNKLAVAFRTNSIDPRAELQWIKLWYTADGVNWIAGPRFDRPRGALALELPKNGRFGLIVQAADTLRNVEPPPVRGSEAELTVEVDGTPPIVRLLGLDKADVYHAHQSFTIRWDKLIDNNLGRQPIRLYFQKLPDTRWLALAGPLADTQSHVWRTPAAGRYRIKLEATDEMGNRAEDVAKKELVIATKAPEVTIVGPRKVLKSEKGVTVRFRVTSELGLPIEKVALFWTLNDGMAWNQLSTFRIAGQEIQHYQDKSYGLRYEARDGPNGIYLVAYDRAGNHNAKPASGTRPMVTYVVDSLPPSLEVVDTLGGKIFGPGEQVSVGWKLAEGRLAEQPITIKLSSDAGYTWPITIASGLANTGSFGFRLPKQPPVSGRYYRVRIEVKDRVGHVGHGVTELFTIDARPPTTRFIAVPPHIDKSPFELQVAVADQDGAGVARVEVFEVALDAAGKPSGAWSRRVIEPWKDARTISFDLQDGRWGLLLVATDGKGNRQAVRGEDAQGQPTAATPPQQRITVHVQGPKVELLTLGGGQTIAGSQPQEIRWRAGGGSVEITRVVLSLSLDGGSTWQPIPGGQALQNVGRFAWSPPTEKDHANARVRVEVFNRYGQRGTAASQRDFYIDNGKPSVSGIEVEEAEDDDKPPKDTPEVKGWLQERGARKQQQPPLVLEPDRPNASGEFDRLAQSAVRHYLDGAYGPAEQALRAALALRGTWGRGNYLLALIEQQQGKPLAQVKRTLQTALAYDETLAEAYNDLGFLYFKEKRHELAESFFRRALAGRTAANAKRNQARFHYNLGLCLRAQQKNAPALAAFEQATAADAGFGEAWFYVALLADQQGNQGKAQQALSRVAALNSPGSPYHEWARARLQKYR